MTAGEWTELLEEPLRKVLEELLSSVHRGCKASATVRLVCTRW